MVTGLDAHVASVSAGSTGACVVKTDSSLWCWGDNSNGELGDGTKTLRAAPVVVTGFSTGGAASVSAGYTYHTCAVKTDGSLWCWGYNWCGQLGDGTKTDRSTPVMVTGFSSGVASVSARGSFTCAVKTDGSLWCWGENYYGQLGDGTITQRLTPVMVTGLSSGVAAVATGGEHTCAVKTDGSLWCWGWNQFGQLGDGTKTNRSTPAVSPGLSAGVASVAAGEASTCAVKTDGSLWCWGSNQDGWLGDGTKTDQSTPQQIPAAPH
jgi:alpha-tubulin suppressor-like RCC1 family protein